MLMTCLLRVTERHCIWLRRPVIRGLVILSIGAFRLLDVLFGLRVMESYTLGSEPLSLNSAFHGEGLVAEASWVFASASREFRYSAST